MQKNWRHLRQWQEWRGTSDPDALEALAEALQALPAKLTEAQAHQALDALLQPYDYLKP